MGNNSSSMSKYYWNNTRVGLQDYVVPIHLNINAICKIDFQVMVKWKKWGFNLIYNAKAIPINSYSIYNWLPQSIDSIQLQVTKIKQLIFFENWFFYTLNDEQIYIHMQKVTKGWTLGCSDMTNVQLC